MCGVRVKESGRMGDGDGEKNRVLNICEWCKTHIQFYPMNVNLTTFYYFGSYIYHVNEMSSE